MKKLIVWAICGLVAVSNTVAPESTDAAERPTLEKTCDPRPDILVHPIYDAYVPYRKQMNRPRYTTGWLLSKINPTSQEAMVWQDNLKAGRYASKDCPPMYRRYFAPKPWEVLTTGARPDTRKPAQPAPAMAAPAGTATQEPAPMPLSQPSALDLLSPSDR